MTQRLLTLALALGVTVPLSASAKVLWRADYETGDISQWTKAQQVSADRLQVQTDRVKEGKYALRATVKQGDNPINASGNRNELVDVTYQPEGAERWYKWSTYFDPGYPSSPKWQVFTQWHQFEDYGSPPIEFDVKGEEIHLTNWTKTIWTTPLRRGEWLDFLFHVKWSKDPKVGFVELWYNGEKVMEKTFLKTDSRVYLKQGLYRHADISAVGVVVHDGMLVGETREDVEPTPPAEEPDAGSGTAPPEGTPDAGTGTTTTTTSQPSPYSTGGGSPANEFDQQSAGCSATGGVAFPLAALALGLLFRRRRAR